MYLAACSGSGSAETATIGVMSAPGVTLAPNPWVPLAASVGLQTTEPTRVALRIQDGDRSWVVRDDVWSSSHPRIPVLGAYPGRTCSIDVDIEDRSGKVTRWPESLTFATSELPADFPPIKVTTLRPELMQSGWTLLHVYTAGRGDWLVAVDEAGKVCWYLNDSLLPRSGNRPSFLVNVLANGNFMLIVDRCGLVEVTPLGDIRSAFWASNVQPCPDPTFYRQVPVDSFHHDVVLMPSDTDADFATLSTELRHYPNYPANVNAPGTTTPLASVIGDVIVELRRDGTVVRQTPLLDRLDPYRMCYDTLSNFWNDFYGVECADWSHANAIVHDATKDQWIVSLRHQDAVVRMDRLSGSIDWILGNHGGWTPQWLPLLLAPMPGLEWQYHQHAPELQPDGSLLMFDNGNNRAMPPTPGTGFFQSWSRAVAFAVDERHRTVAQTWAYGAPPGTGADSFYSFFVGDANQLANGNVLICDGGKLEGPPRLNTFGRVVEVTHTENPRIALEVVVRDEAATAPTSYFCYRAFRLPSFRQ